MRYLRLGVAWLLFVWLLGAGDLLAEAASRRTWVYGMFSGLALLMDVHHPDAANGHGVIFVPGNAWTAPTAK